MPACLQESRLEASVDAKRAVCELQPGAKRWLIAVPGTFLCSVDNCWSHAVRVQMAWLSTARKPGFAHETLHAQALRAELACLLVSFADAQIVHYQGCEA